MPAKKIFSESSPYKTEDGKRKSVTVYCTIFDNLDWVFHNGDDNPNMIISGSSLEDVEKETAKNYCKSVIFGRLYNYLREERKILNSKPVNP